MSERERGVVATFLGDGLSLDKKAFYELDMSRGRNNCPRKVFSCLGRYRSVPLTS